MALLSELVWVAIFIVGLVWELIGVFTEKRSGIEPLTHIVRDRLMRRSKLWYVGVLVFWVWLGIHFFLEGGA